MSSSKFLPKAYLKGQIIPFQEANVSIATQALHYGVSAFGGMRAFLDVKTPGSIALFRPDLHFKRLSESAGYLNYSLSSKDVEKAVELFIRSNPGDKPYYIRPLVYVSDLGLVPRLHNVEYDFLIYGVEFGDYLNKDGISLCFSSWTKIPSTAIPAKGKIGGVYVNSALAKTEAFERGFDEALMINSAGKLAEGSTTNIFIVKNNQLITPTTDDDILEGITRRSVIEIASDLDIKVIEKEINKQELFEADEVFMCGTAAQITPVSKIEDHNLPTDKPLTKKLSDIFEQITKKQTGKYAGWMQSFEAS